MKANVHTGGRTLKFYRVAALTLLALISVSAGLIAFGAMQARLNILLFPMSESRLPWVADVVPKDKTLRTFNEVLSETDVIEYQFLLSSEEPYPYAAYTFDFAHFSDPEAVVDLSRHSKVSFRIRCAPRNVLLFVLFTLDGQVTDTSDPGSRRVASTFFSCDEDWKTMTVHLDELYTPDWWLHHYGLELTHRGYHLDKAFGFGLVNSLDSPRDTLSRVTVTDLRLHGKDNRYLYAALALVGLGWLAFLAWTFHGYVRALIGDVKDKVRQDRPLIAYKELSIAPHKDKAKSSVLRYMATEYANPELSLEAAISATGLNRNRINAILKEEIGLTFSAYLNKLRLTEAARLLSEQPDASVAEIAYSVGYNNVTYFNKLFKNEYSCSPKTFKTLYKEEGSNPQLFCED